MTCEELDKLIDDTSVNDENLKHNNKTGKATV